MVLLLLALVWMRIATLFFALCFGSATPPLAILFESLFLSMQGVTFLAVGTAIGTVPAFVAYAISVVSVPPLVNREADADRGSQPV